VKRQVAMLFTTADRRGGRHVRAAKAAVERVLSTAPPASQQAFHSTLRREQAS
jgi:hypothetical protein